MSQTPNKSQIISMKLSEVLGDIGVSEKMVMKRRRTFMLMEAVENTTLRLLGKDINSYNFGSQSEGSTTMELNSDIDTLYAYHNLNVIQNLSEWKPEAQNILMVQDETTPPGYCLLQFLQKDVPLPITAVRRDEKHVVVDGKGRVLMKNTFFDHLGVNYDGKNGPAHVYQGNAQTNAQDNVSARYCKSWPTEAKPWLLKQGIGGWPTEDIKRYCKTTGCFVVPVGSTSGKNEELEWRISTSHAERCLMFSLNITQIRCYVLMKMILKTFINPECNDVITSFMCKTVLFHYIHNTKSAEWQADNLLQCLKSCLSKLQNNVENGNCPHFIVPQNNLLKGKISASVKPKLTAILQSLMDRCTDGDLLQSITIDCLGLRYMVKMGILPDILLHKTIQHYNSPSRIHGTLLGVIATLLSIYHVALLKNIMEGGNEIEQSRSFVDTLVRRYDGMALSRLEKSAYILLIPFLCSSLASAIASHDLDINKTISSHALALFSAGLNSDLSSGKLKLTSALYCSGDMDRTVCILQNTECEYDKKNVETICKCWKKPVTYIHVRQGFFDKASTGSKELIKYITSFCVRFLPCEMKCVPHELRYEMYRSTQEDMFHRNEDKDYWMDWAVVDSLPYLYFLQYKTFGHLQKATEQQRALTELIQTVETEPNLGHRETALNLIGQCMEQENRQTDALNFYVRSLNTRERNNVAKIHICRLLNILINGKVADK
ncbi:uncharacterized protein LOC128557716 [Mercenaria mercenaria]|uniref:uncharacterized protein LOC128557716 n=1 Tax=Mercenaria mercenaria TaxID=6596 RepID=UPI00234EF910|nr:uncharacterized protein LOC128557716 [Mercenaria mercenaria]